MKVSELEAEVKKVGLLSARTSDGVAELLQVYTPYDDNKGFQLDDGLWYLAISLSKEEVDKLNDRYVKLIPILKKNNITTVRTSPIDNGVISDCLIHLKNFDLDDRLQRKPPGLDYEIQTDVEKIKTTIGFVKYEKFFPPVTGFGYRLPKFESRKLKSHEIAMVVRNTADICKMYKETQNLEWIINFIKFQKNIQPLQEVVNLGLMDPKLFVEAILPNKRLIDDIGYPTFIKILTVLSPLTITGIDLEKDTYYFPKNIFEIPIFDKIMKNWEFTKSTGRKILKDIILAINSTAFKKFIATKKSEDYYLDDWKELQEPVLGKFCISEPKLLDKLVKEGWMPFESIKATDITLFIIEYLNFDNLFLLSAIIRLFLKNNQDHDLFLRYMLNQLQHEDANNKSISGDVFDIIMKNINFNLLTVKRLMINDGVVMAYLEKYEKDHPLKHMLLSSGEFVEYLVKSDQTKYLPDVAEIFMF